MENVAIQIEEKSHEKLMIYNDLLNIFIQEKKSIINADVTALWKFSSLKQKKVEEIGKIRKEILSILGDAGIEHGMQLNSFEFGKVVDLFFGEHLNRLTKKMIAINRLKAEIQISGKANKQFIEEYLSTISELMNIFVGNTCKSGLYNRESSFSRNRDNETVLFSREV